MIHIAPQFHRVGNHCPLTHGIWLNGTFAGYAACYCAAEKVAITLQETLTMPPADTTRCGVCTIGRYRLAQCSHCQVKLCWGCRRDGHHCKGRSAGEHDQAASSQRLAEYRLKCERQPDPIIHDNPPFERLSGLGELAGRLARFHRAPSKRKVVLR